MKRKFTVTGMTCSACSSHVERAVGKADGVRSVSVNLLTGTMQVDFDENVINEDGIAEVVKGAGYGAYAEQSDSAQSPKSKPDKNSEIAGRSGARVEETRKMRVRLIVSLVFTVLLMYVAMGHMAGAPLPSFLVGTGNAVSYALVQLLLCLPVIYVNRAYYINGFRRLVRLSPNMDSLIAVGSAASLVYGIFVIFRMSYALGAGDVAVVERYMHDLYFESAAMILALVTVGKYLESVSKRRTGDALDKLIGLAPDTAVVIRDGRETAVNSADLSVGDEIVVRAGAAVPADAVVTEGNAFMDESAISGESVPVEKSEGDGIIGGTVNRSGYVVARVTAVGGDSMLAKIVKLVEDAGASKAPIASAADKIAGFFVPVVMAVAVVTLAGWLIAGYAFEHAFTCAVSVLVISCPCALGLATPVAVMVGTGKGAESGVLFKSGEALQNMHDVKVVALDKTGTVTEGTPEVSEVSIARDAEEILAAVAAIEKRSEHPLGTAVVAYAERNGMAEREVLDFVTLPGKGVTAYVGGVRYAVGNSALMADEGVNGGEYAVELDRITAEGKTPLLIAREGEYAGMIATADKVKPTSAQAVRELRKLGVRVVMLTGDNERTARAVAAQAGIDEVYAGILPQDKERIVGELSAHGKVAMVGDGINDAPALARADVGVAIGSGSDIAVDSADVVLIKSDLVDVVTAVRLSRSTLRNIKENLFWALFYNSLCIPLAAGVLYVPFGVRLSPVIGAAAMSVSSLFVVFNALRLKLFRPTRAEKVCGDVCEVGKSVAAGDRVAETERATELCRKGGEAADNEAKPSNESGSGKVRLLPSENKSSEDGNMKTFVIEVKGMMCGHCTARVEKALLGVEGVRSATASLADGTATVVAENVTAEALKAAVEAQDYGVGDVREK